MPEALLILQDIHNNKQGGDFLGWLGFFCFVVGSFLVPLHLLVTDQKMGHPAFVQRLQ